MILSENNFNANQLNLNVRFWKYSRESNYYKRYPWPVLKFASSKKYSDDGGVKKTNKRGNGRFWKMIDLPVAYLPQL